MAQAMSMTTQSGEPEHGASVVNALESIREQALTLRLTVLTVGMQLMLRAMLLLRRWNY